MSSKKNKNLKNSSAKIPKPKASSQEDMQVKLLRDVVANVAGPEAVGIVDLLSGKKNVNEFTIAEKLKITINQTRNILYKLSDEGLVSFVRKKDKKNGGWYTYFWTLETGKSIENLRILINSKIESLEKELNKRKQDRFYHCTTCDLEYNEEDALQNFFSCVECGGVLELKDNSAVIDNLNREIENLRRDLAVVDEQHGMIVKKEGAVIARKARAEERKKEMEREKKRKTREIEKKKEAKATEKGPGKKKPAEKLGGKKVKGKKISKTTSKKNLSGKQKSASSKKKKMKRVKSSRRGRK